MAKAGTIIIKYSLLLRDAMSELLKNDPLRMAGATAFFTTFALPPILVILIQAFKLFSDSVSVRVELFKSLTGVIGPEAVRQLVEVLKALRKIAHSEWIAAGGFIFLLFVATTLFKIIKSSINQVWKIRRVEKQGLARGIGARLRSIAVILIAGLLLMVGVLGEGLQAVVGRYIFDFSPVLSHFISLVLNYTISISVVTMWFMIVFRFLPDARASWRIVFRGALLTALFFTLGKILLHWLLSYSNINTVYGTSAAIVLLLLFVFYSSLILYYGAAFTKLLAQRSGQPIRPLPYAIHYRLVEENEEEQADERP